MTYDCLKGIAPKHWSNGVAIKVILKKKLTLQRAISLHGFSSNNYLKLSRGIFILIQKNGFCGITNAYKMNLVLIVFPLTFTHPGQHSVTRCHALSSPTVLPTGLASRASHPPLAATTHPHSLSVSHHRDWKPGNWFQDATAARPLKWSWHVYSSQKDTGGLFSQEKQPKLQGCFWTKKLWKGAKWLVDEHNGHLLWCSNLWAKPAQSGFITVNILYGNWNLNQVPERLMVSRHDAGMPVYHKFCDWN